MAEGAEPLDKLGAPGHAPLAGAAPATPEPGKGTKTAPPLPRTTREAGAVRPTAAHHAAPARVAETEDDGEELNAIVKVVAYGAGGKVIARWGARARWEGRLPVQFHGTRGQGWRWSNPAARETRVHTNPDGTGGMSIEAWARQVGANSIDVFAQAAEDVTLRKDGSKDGHAPEDNHAPGHALDEREAGDGSSSQLGRGHARGEDPVSAPAGDHSARADDQEDPTSEADELDQAAPDPAEEQLLEEIEHELGILSSPDGEGDARATGGHGKAGGDPTGRTGSDTEIDGTGPGGEQAKADGDGDGSVTGRAENGTAAGSERGVKHGSDDGLFAGEGRDGDDGIRGTGAVFGGVIAIPAALKGLVEIGLILDAGNVTGAGGNLFKRSLRKLVPGAARREVTREVVVAARRELAREARIHARAELKRITKHMNTNKAFLALAKEERARVMRLWLWETQRRYFRAYLKAAQAEQRAVRNALKKAKRGDVAALKARRAASDAGEEVATVEPVAGRLPRNHQYAGKEFPRAELPPEFRAQGLRFKTTGHPDFEPFAMVLPNGKKTVRITYQGSRAADFAAANEAAKLARTPEGWIWHHGETVGELMLVPKKLHETVAHSGGVAGHRHLTGAAKYD